MRDAPLARPVNAGPTARPVFSRITAQDEDDDEISDAEDGDDDVPFALGKRDRPQKKQESEKDGERPNRRQVGPMTPYSSTVWQVQVIDILTETEHSSKWRCRKEGELYGSVYSSSRILAIV